MAEKLHSGKGEILTPNSLAITSETERYIPSLRPYNAALHLGHMASYREALRYSYGRRVLDVGCGAGYGSFFLATYGAVLVVAVDNSAAAIEYARSTYHHPRLIYLQADSLQLPLADASFDFVISSQVIEHVASSERFLTEIKRLLTPEGFCLITTPNRDLFSPGDETINPHHLNEMSWNVFKQKAKTVFPSTQFRGIPQCCLSIDEPNLPPRTKSNFELRLSDFKVQDYDLDKCENMLCYGFKQPEPNLIPTLPEELLPVANELAPIFWDPAISRWVIMGVYTTHKDVAPFELSGRKRVEQVFESPYKALYRIEIDLAEPLSMPVKVKLKRAICLKTSCDILLTTTVTEPRDIIELVFDPMMDSEGQFYVISLELASPIHRLLKRRSSVKLETAIGQLLEKSFLLNGKQIEKQMAIRTFHLILPRGFF